MAQTILLFSYIESQSPHDIRSWTLRADSPGTYYAGNPRNVSLESGSGARRRPALLLNCNTRSTGRMMTILVIGLAIVIGIVTTVIIIVVFSIFSTMLIVRVHLAASMN